MKSIDTLRHDHELILKSLAVLGALADRLRGGEEVPGDDVGQLLGFFRDFADKYHHSKEELSLFPTLGERGLPPHGGPVAVMLHEHDLGRALVRQLEQAAEELGAGAEAKQRFADLAYRFEELLGSHIHKENQVLWPMAERILGADDDARLSVAFEAHATRVLPAGEQARLEALPGALAARYL